MRVEGKDEVRLCPSPLPEVADSRLPDLDPENYRAFIFKSFFFLHTYNINHTSSDNLRIPHNAQQTYGITCTPPESIATTYQQTPKFARPKGVHQAIGHQPASTTPRTSIMKLFSAVHEFEYSWEEVSSANWQKYGPWNNKSEHVIAVDTLSRTLDPKTHILRTERLITCKQSAPQFVRTILGSQDTSLVYEVSYVDPAAKRVTMCSQNMTWSDLLSVQETVAYTPTIGDAKTTRFEQTARVTALCGGWQRIKNTIEEVTVERFRQNAARGKEGFERVLAISREVFAEQREQRRREQGRAAL